MSPARRRSNKRRTKNQARTAPPAEFWRAAPEPPEPPDIIPADDPTALLRSMGAPPLPGQQAAALPYFEAVAQRAAILGTALVASADLLDDGSDDESPAE